MRYMHFAAAGAWAALANLLQLHGERAEDVELVLGGKLHAMLEWNEERGRYLTGSQLQGEKWYNLCLMARGWQYMEFSYSREEALDYLWPLTMLKLQLHDGLPTDVVYLGDVDDVYTFIPSVHETEGDMRIELSREELLQCLPETVALGSVRRRSPQEAEWTADLHESQENWEKLRQECQTFLAQEHTPAEIRDAVNRFLHVPLHEGEIMLRELGHHDAANEMATMYRRVLRAVAQGESLRLGDVLDETQIENAIVLLRQL